MNVVARTSNYQKAVVIGLLGLVLLSLIPEEAHAQARVRVIGGPGTRAENTLVGIARQIRSDVANLVQKERVDDPAQNALNTRSAMATREQLRQYTTAGGTEGEGFIMKNLEVLKATSDAITTTNFITEIDESNNICSTYEAEVLAAIRDEYREENLRNVTDKNNCAFDDVEGADVDAFIEDGEFNLQAFYTSTRDPENSIPLAVTLATAERIKEQREELWQNRRDQVVFIGQGALPLYANGLTWERCLTEEVNGVFTEECVVSTPASVMLEHMKNILQIDIALKTNGDEFQETQAQLIDQAIAPLLVTGLSGTARASVPGVTPPPTTPPTTPPIDIPTLNNPNSAFPQVPNDPQDPTTLSFLAQVSIDLSDSEDNDPAPNPIRDALTRTLTQLQLHLQVITTVNDFEVRSEETRERYSSINCYDLPVQAFFLNERFEVAEKVPTVLDAIKALYALLLAYDQAVANGQSTASVLNDYQELLTTAFAIPSAAELPGIIADFNEGFGRQVNIFNQQHQDQVEACELILNPPEDEEDQNDPGNNAGP